MWIYQQHTSLQFYPIQKIRKKYMVSTQFHFKKLCLLLSVVLLTTKSWASSSTAAARPRPPCASRPTSSPTPTPSTTSATSGSASRTPGAAPMSWVQFRIGNPIFIVKSVIVFVFFTSIYTPFTCREYIDGIFVFILLWIPIVNSVIIFVFFSSIYTPFTKGILSIIYVFILLWIPIVNSVIILVFFTSMSPFCKQYSDGSYFWILFILLYPFTKSILSIIVVFILLWIPIPFVSIVYWWSFLYSLQSFIPLL